MGISKVLALLGVYAAAANAATTYSISTTVVGADGIATVPWPPTCTAVGTQVYAVYDTAQNELWNYMCGAATVSGLTSLPNQAALSSWRDCFALCDATMGCTSFSYNLGSVNGEGAGTCFMKTTLPPAYTSTTALSATRVAALRVRYRKFVESING